MLLCSLHFLFSISAARKTIKRKIVMKILEMFHFFLIYVMQVHGECRHQYMLCGATNCTYKHTHTLSHMWNKTGRYIFAVSKKKNNHFRWKSIPCIWSGSLFRHSNKSECEINSAHEIALSVMIGDGVQWRTLSTYTHHTLTFPAHKT